MSEEPIRIPRRPSAEPLHPRPPTPEPAAPRRRFSNLTRRLLTAAILVPTVIAMIVAGGLWYVGTVVVIVLLGLYELYGPERLRKFSPASPRHGRRNRRRGSQTDTNEPESGA